MREESLSSAIQRLRAHDISGASVAEVMKGAALTSVTRKKRKGKSEKRT